MGLRPDLNQGHCARAAHPRSNLTLIALRTIKHSADHPPQAACCSACCVHAGSEASPTSPVEGGGGAGGGAGTRGMHAFAVGLSGQQKGKGQILASSASLQKENAQFDSLFHMKCKDQH